MSQTRRPPFLLDGIHIARQGGIQQYDSKRDKYLKDYYENQAKKQENPKSSMRMQTESNRYLQHSSDITLNQSIQQNQKLGYRVNQRAKLSSQYQHQSSPDYIKGHSGTPAKKRGTEFSLPKLESAIMNQNDSLQQPVTKEQLLLFLDQIRFAVENVQQIVCKNDNLQQQIQQSQPIRSIKKFKITQEQQTDNSYIQQQLKNKNCYINKVNKKTQTPIKEIRSSSQHQDPQLMKIRTTKLKTEQTEESDATQKKGTRFPNIGQSGQQMRVQKVQPSYKTNRVQSEMLIYQQVVQSQNELNQQDTTNKIFSSNDTQQFSNQSNIMEEDLSENQPNTKKSEQIKHSSPKQPIKTSNQASTQKKLQKPQKIYHQQQMIETNKNAIVVQQQNSQQQQKSIQQLSSQGYSVDDFEDPFDQIKISQSSDREILVEKEQPKQCVPIMEEQSNAQITPKLKKRPLQIRNPNPSENNETDNQTYHNQKEDQKTVEMKQITDIKSQPLSKQQQYTNQNDEDYEYSNEFLSEQGENLVKPESKIVEQQNFNRAQSLKQSQSSSKKALEINPQADFFPEQQENQKYQKNLNQSELQVDKQNDQEMKVVIQQNEQDEKQQIGQSALLIEDDKQQKSNNQINVSKNDSNSKQEPEEEETVAKQNYITPSKEEINPTLQQVKLKGEQFGLPQEDKPQQIENMVQSSLTVQSVYISKDQIAYSKLHQPNNEIKVEQINLERDVNEINSKILTQKSNDIEQNQAVDQQSNNIVERQSKINNDEAIQLQQSQQLGISVLISKQVEEINQNNSPSIIDQQQIKSQGQVSHNQSEKLQLSNNQHQEVEKHNIERRVAQIKKINQEGNRLFLQTSQAWIHQQSIQPVSNFHKSQLIGREQVELDQEFQKLIKLTKKKSDKQEVTNQDQLIDEDRHENQQPSNREQEQNHAMQQSQSQEQVYNSERRKIESEKQLLNGNQSSQIQDQSNIKQDIEHHNLKEIVQKTDQHNNQEQQ